MRPGSPFFSAFNSSSNSSSFPHAVNFMCPDASLINLLHGAMYRSTISCKFSNSSSFPILSFDPIVAPGAFSNSYISICTMLLVKNFHVRVILSGPLEEGRKINSPKSRSFRRSAAFRELMFLNLGWLMRRIWNLRWP
jgi:hypothetical protein